MPQTVVIPYKPRPWALPFHGTKKRWIVLVIHRRAGKTTAALNHLQRDALTLPNSRYAYIAPTYKQAKNIAWDLLKHYARPVPGAEFNEAELTARYPNGSRLTLYGADNPDSLRGIGLWGVCFDEYSQQPSNIFTEIIRPALADHRGYSIWIGTPKGKNEFYRLFELGRKDEGWLTALLTVDDTKIISEQELEDARKVMSPDEFAQEWYCSFEASIKGAYYAEQLHTARKEGRIKLVPYDPILKVHTVYDLGVGANLSVGYFQRIPNEIRLIDYWQGVENEGIVQAIAEAKKKPYVFGKHFFPHDASAREETTGKTRVAVARELWGSQNVHVLRAMNPKQRIEIGQRMFPRFWVNEPKCEQFLDALAAYRREWIEAKGMFKDEPLHDWASHPADMYSHAALAEDQMTNDDVTPYEQPEYERSGL